MLMPCLLFQEKDACKLRICGGTHVGMSPTVHPIQNVLLPHLLRMGIEARLEVETCGFFPDVVGSVNLEIKSLKSHLSPFDLTERGG